MKTLISIATTWLLVMVVWPAFLSAQGQNVNAASTRTVTGTQIGHFKNGPLPTDLSTATVAAYVPNGNGYTVISGSGTNKGTFTIANVPTGFYVLQLGTDFLVTSNSVVDADYNRAYRNNVVLADQNTVTFDLTNVNLWQSEDALEMVCTNNSAFNVYQEAAGQNTFTGTYGYYGPLSDGSQGDQNYILQLVTQNVGNYVFNALGRGFLPPKFTQQPGDDTPINGKMAVIPQTHTFEANVNGADLTAQTLASNPNAQFTSTGLALDVYPGSLSKGENTSTPDLVVYNAFGDQPLLTTNTDLGPVAYGNPFPASSWPLFVVYSWVAQMNYVAPGATNNAAIVALNSGFNTTLPNPTNPIKPLTGVGTNPRINGGDFFTDTVGVGTNPTLKWSAPNVGGVTFYEVDIFQLTNNNGNTVKALVAQVLTPATSFTVPQGLMVSGSGFVFRVRTWYTPGVNFAKTPYMNGPVFAVADLLSGMMQP